MGSAQRWPRRSKIFYVSPVQGEREFLRFSQTFKMETPVPDDILDLFGKRHANQENNSESKAEDLVTAATLSGSKRE